MMFERGDRKILNEPYALAYYYGPQGYSPRYGKLDFNELLNPDNSYAEAHKAVQQASMEDPLFIKEIGRNVRPYLNQRFCASFCNTVLIRHPLFSLHSLRQQVPTFTDEEAGYSGLAEVYSVARQVQEHVPVIDSSDLLLNPTDMIRKWCDAVNIAFMPESLKWETGKCAVIGNVWSDFHVKVFASKGFEQRDEWACPPKADEYMAKRIDALRPIYESIVADKISVCEYK